MLTLNLLPVYFLLFSLIAVKTTECLNDDLPTLYEYYTTPQINSGLSDKLPYFTLNSKNITIYSGTIHYFRVPRAYWRDRLRKMRAAGLNAIETYIPWNLHEPQPGQFDFGNGGSDMEDFLHLEEFLQIVKEEDLFAIIRPGPFICAEWEFGGFPSWILRAAGIKVRTSDLIYMDLVTQYFNKLLPLLVNHQFTKGGPIIIFQVENEYGSTERKGSFTPDRKYLKLLRSLYINNGITELLVTSDSPSSHGDAGTLPGLFLQTANFGGDPTADFKALQKLQPNKPVMAMEFWTGWFDHWGETHHVRNNTDFENVVNKILAYPASFNMYMFMGGTSFGFMNGANTKNDKNDNSGLQPDTTSYDYDAPLSEAGDYTEKYVIVKKLIEKYNKVHTKLPLTPSLSARKTYDPIPLEAQQSLSAILDNNVESRYFFHMKSVEPMETLDINNNSGQSYGYILYRKTGIDIPENSTLTISGHVCDTVTVLVNGVLRSKPLAKESDLNNFGFWRKKDSSLILRGPRNNATLDLLVENFGRVNFGYLEVFRQFKGLWQGDVLLNNEPIKDWTAVPLEFKKKWNNNLNLGWSSVTRVPGPALYKAILDIEGSPKDTFVNMQKWTKGIVIVNGFVLGRYSRIGPQQTLYLPAPLLKSGVNTIIVFEHYAAGTRIEFSEDQIFKTLKRIK